MDAPGLDPVVLEECLDQVAASNRWLGARRALLGHLDRLIPPGSARLLDAGTASADLPRAMVHWGRDTGRSLRILALDRHPQTLEIARHRTRPFPEIELARADVRSLPCAGGAFDIALLSLTLHHLEGADAEGALRELGRVARWVVVGELERSWPHYLGARVLAATLWRGNRLTRHDAPLSVRRGYTARELEGLAVRAGLVRPAVHRHPFYRLVLVARGT